LAGATGQRRLLRVHQRVDRGSMASCNSMTLANLRLQPTALDAIVKRRG
jgi:hypothetical protein